MTTEEKLKELISINARKESVDEFIQKLTALKSAVLEKPDSYVPISFGGIMHEPGSFGIVCEPSEVEAFIDVCIDHFLKRKEVLIDTASQLMKS